MKASNQTKKVQVVTIEIDDPAEVAALRAALARYDRTTGMPDLSAMATLAKTVVEAIVPPVTYRDVSPVARIMSEPGDRTASH